MFALLVPSCCDLSGTSRYHLVTKLITVTDLLQIVPTRLIQAVCNKLLRACCHQLVTCRRYKTCWSNLLRVLLAVGLINLVTRRQQLVPDLSTTGNKQCKHILLTSCEIFTRVECGSCSHFIPTAFR